jgi:hypothetical protein
MQETNCPRGNIRRMQTTDADLKAALDPLLLKIPGVQAADMAGMRAYFVAKKMFACICNGGVGIRLSTGAAAQLQFARSDVVPFEPKGRPSSREWIQINRIDPADYAKDLDVFQSSVDFVRGAGA